MKLRNKSGITLIALIVTIIVLIIIAGISIATLTADNGILRQTNAAKISQLEGTTREQVKLAVAAMRLAVAEAQAKDNSYSAKSNASLIQAKLIEVLNADKKDLTGSFSNGGTEATDETEKFTIVYEGEDYKNATNNPDAKITYTIALGQKTVELYKEQTSIQKDSEGGNVSIDIGAAVEPGLYETGSNFKVLLKTWDELIEEGVVHVDDGIVTTNYDTETGANSSAEILIGELALPESVTTIGVQAFRQCTNLTSVILSNNVTDIGKQAFTNCTGLSSVAIPNSVTNMDTYIFYGCTNLTSVELPDNMTSIPGWMFTHCSNLENIEISSNVTNIGDAAFGYCSSLSNVIIPNSVTNMGIQIFYGCSNLKSVELPDNITIIPQSMFYGCSSLTSIDIPNSVTSIDKFAFRGCTNITSFKLPNGITSISDYTFTDTGITSIGPVNSGASLEIPYSVTSIGTGAFWKCTSLVSAEIPDNITNLANGLFADCSNLTTVKIPNSVTIIEDYALNRTGISMLDIPETVMQIGQYAINSIPSLRTINFRGTSEQWKSITFGKYWNSLSGKVEDTDSYEFEVICTGETPNVTIKYINGEMQ